ncbi:HAD family hydrolase [Streptomyces albus]|uniref:HAD family hydrolase n=1 Tax=Streptomyces sp. PHES57 TaxID=2872626 RepID=UPI001CED9DA7|nr:HAD family hydrolase [Streptomyces sp. PHES57]
MTRPPAHGTHGRTLVASDLDRTLIYSAPALELTMPDASAPRLLCVETYEHKPLSFMTEQAARLLAALADEALFVPATTRTPEQYLRVHLPGPPPRYAVCANGGHLLVDGESDPEWREHVAGRLTECAPLDQVRAHMLEAARPEWLLKERVADGLFAYLVVERSLLPGTWVKELAEWAGDHGWSVSLQGRKVYAVPHPLTKSAAVAEVARRTGTGRTLAAGDSLLDADLLQYADGAWRPGHGELADSGWAAPHLRALADRGVLAGERILHEMTAALTEEAATPPHSVVSGPGLAPAVSAPPLAAPSRAPRPAR